MKPHLLRRFLARLLDLLLVLCLAQGLELALGRAPLDLFWAWPLFSFLALGLTGSTPGKHLLSLSLQRPNGQALSLAQLWGRELLFWLLWPLVLFQGILGLAQPLHDRLIESQSHVG